MKIENLIENSEAIVHLAKKVSDIKQALAIIREHKVEGLTDRLESCETNLEQEILQSATALRAILHEYEDWITEEERASERAFEDDSDDVEDAQ